MAKNKEIKYVDEEEGQSTSRPEETRKIKTEGRRISPVYEIGDPFFSNDDRYTANFNGE